MDQTHRQPPGHTCQGWQLWRRHSTADDDGQQHLRRWLASLWRRLGDGHHWTRLRIDCLQWAFTISHPYTHYWTLPLSRCCLWVSVRHIELFMHTARSSLIQPLLPLSVQNELCTTLKPPPPPISLPECSLYVLHVHTTTDPLPTSPFPRYHYYCLWVYTHTHTQTRTHTNTHTHTHTHTHTNTHTLKYTHNHTHTILVIYCEYNNITWRITPKLSA